MWKQTTMTDDVENEIDDSNMQATWHLYNMISMDA
jgi:hypothetical protein